MSGSVLIILMQYSQIRLRSWNIFLLKHISNILFLIFIMPNLILILNFIAEVYEILKIFLYLICILYNLDYMLIAEISVIY